MSRPRNTFPARTRPTIRAAAAAANAAPPATLAAVRRRAAARFLAGSRRRAAQIQARKRSETDVANKTPSASTSSAGIDSAGSASGTSPSRRRDLQDSFHAWALKTYGDSAKTKTVTRKKHNRIVKILCGEEQNSAENSKFRFWVKAKGFRLGPLNDASTNKSSKNQEHVLYVPCSQSKYHI
uniref:Nucleolar protein 4 n=1 Tax=Strigamia maritima TaxID=126957 RepID=T1JJP5_STRMM